MDEDRKQAIERLKEASPLEATKILQEMELYDARSSQEIIDEIYDQFATGENMVDEIVKPVFLSVIDGFLEGTSIGKSARKKGLTASRFIQECESFGYENEPNISDVNGYIERKNAEDFAKEYGEKTRTKFSRDIYEDQGAMDNYKKNKVIENGGNKNLEDEYTGKRNITPYRNNPDMRHNDSNNKYQAETDHVIPLKQIHDQFKNNYALSDDDIRKIANQENNIVLTSAELNRKKLDNKNSEFIKKQEKLKKEGNPYYEIDEETKKNMLKSEKEAQKSINKSANQTILKNLTGNGTVDRKDKKEKYKEEEERLGRSLSKDEKIAIDKKLASKKQKDIIDNCAKNAKDQAKDYAVGNLILYIVKPIYYEISDIFKNGLSEGVEANSSSEALKIRFGRIKKYIVENAASFLGNSMLDFIKGFISSLIEGIIGLFVGIFKQVLKILKEGIKIFVQSAKVLFGKGSKNMTPSQKGDAIIKILGGGVIAISGVAIEAILTKISIDEPWSVILSTMLSGIASALFMYILNKADIFSVTAEKRRDRIVEVFNERIKDINEAAESCNVVAIETLRKQRNEFEEINSQIDNGIKTNDIDVINTGLNKMAAFMHVDLEYSNLEEFCDYIDSDDKIYL